MTQSKSLLSRIKQQLPANEFFLDPAVCNQYATDKWMASHLPDAVALPRSATTLSAILRLAHQHHIPVTPRGAGHGYVGGCVPVRGGIVISVERMRRIREIHPRDFVAVVEAGVITEKLQSAVEKRGLFYPPDPASRADSSISGNIATNAGGPRCLKYGVTRDYVLGLQVALADGTLVRLGSRTHKNKTGFDLARLFVGSEGLLGIITEATLKLIPLPPQRAALSVGYDQTSTAAQAIESIFAAGFLPCALEIADEFTLQAAQKYTGNPMLAGCKAHLIVEMDGQQSSVRSETKAVETLVRRLNPRFVRRALGAAECEKIWELRRVFSTSLKSTGLTKMNEDVTVPRGRLEDLLRFAARLQKRHRLPIACFGHAGDGNIHVNVMLDESQDGFAARRDAALNELFAQVLAWGGVLTGEHGIGLAKKPWWNQAVPAEVRQLHQTIKRALDPRGILNPGKFV
ncbi:MAG TPA: FAD-linked oxidase C-terminal domain-containing protein [Candidatus Paceibacterota bacterium]|nr:FAD-linked oxidase C-terminal domain-containing protein [Verrucomicrobiota bacterium]HRY47859.1 FAD-linked oxidase C-terminal domain-containing protein [Candidatus Paceibacterota bacterium]